jgi:hypothetical protein
VDAKTGLLAFEYPEITGYALSFIAAGALPESARSVGSRAAAWLVDRMRRQHFVARDGRDNEAIFLFDLGMIASGLLSFGARTRADDVVAGGERVVAFIERELHRARPISPIARGRRPERRAWSTDGVAHLAKLAQCLLLSDRFAESRALTRLIETVKQLQRPNGRIPTEPGDTTTMLHAHFYAAEGLWVWGAARGDEDALDRARAALDWACARQLESGGFPRAIPDGRPVEQSDVTAQALRLALLLQRRTPEVARAISRLIELAHGSDGKLSIVYQPASPDIHLNTWTTLFAAQALELAAPGASAISWRQLV